MVECLKFEWLEILFKKIKQAFPLERRKQALKTLLSRKISHKVIPFSEWAQPINVVGKFKLKI